MAKRNNLADVRKYIKDGDLEEAVDVLRESMKATTTVVKATAPKSRTGKAAGKSVTVEVADNSTRLAAARLLMEYGFGKPIQQQHIELDDGQTTKLLTQDEVVGRLAESGIDLKDVLDTYVENLPEAVPASENEHHNQEDHEQEKDIQLPEAEEREVVGEADRNPFA